MICSILTLGDLSCNNITTTKMGGEAMEKTILKGEKISYSPSKDFKINDIIVFKNYSGNERNSKVSIFRIGAKSGDVIEFRKGLTIR